MQDVKVLIPADLDEVTVKLNANNKVEADFNVVKEYVHSRAGGLITNGYGTLKNNTNFSKFEFSPSRATIGAGAFSTGVRNADFAIDEIIPVSPELEYTFSFYAQSLGYGTNNKAYAYIVPIDVDGLPITPIFMNEISFLVERVQSGENYIIVHEDDRQKVEAYFRPKANSNYMMMLLNANYGTTSGYQYPTGTYSRTMLSQTAKRANQLTYDPVTGRLEGHDITTTMTEGNMAGISTAAGTYIYLVPNLVDAVIPSTPTYYSKTFTLKNATNSPLHKRMLAVASFIKVGWLLNRGQTTGHETAIWAVDLRASVPQQKVNDGAGQVVFTDKAATVDLQLNGIKFIFRQVANSNKPMIMTGVHYQGEWWGDAPNGEPFNNPFT